MIIKAPRGGFFAPAFICRAAVLCFIKSLIRRCYDCHAKGGEGIFFLAFVIAGSGYSEALWHVLDHPRQVWFSRYIPLHHHRFRDISAVHFLFHRLIVLHVFGHEINSRALVHAVSAERCTRYTSRARKAVTRNIRAAISSSHSRLIFPALRDFFMILHLIVADRFVPYIDGLLDLISFQSC